MNQLKISGRLLAKNTILNFIGQVIPLLVAVATIPYVIRGLGVERFGIFSLAWVVLGYFSLLDLGLGRATTKFVAEALGKNEIGKIRSIVWTSLIFQFLLGIFASIILVIAIPFLVEKVLNIPSDLIKETKKVFYILSFSIPIVISSASLRGVLEAEQRFDLVNAVKIPSSSISFLIALLAAFKFTLPSIILLLIVYYLCVALVYLLLCLKVCPVLRKGLTIELNIVNQLLTYGVWMFVHTVASSTLPMLDRFIIGSRLTIESVGYYSVPYDTVSRLSIIPASLIMTLFPAFSTIGMEHKDKLERFYTNNIKYLILSMLPLFFILFVFSKELLQLWLGEKFAIESTSALRWFLTANLVGSVSHIPITLLQSLGRPDIITKVIVVEMPFYIVLSWLLVGKIGITGAAISWTLIILINAVIFFSAVQKVVKINLSTFVKNRVIHSAIVGLGLVFMAILLVSNLGNETLIRSIIAILSIFLLFILRWWLFNERERDFITFLKKRYLNRPIGHVLFKIRNRIYQNKPNQ